MNYGLCTWANEQAMRGLYFVPFELAAMEKATSASAPEPVGRAGIAKMVSL